MTVICDCTSLNNMKCPPQNQMCSELPHQPTVDGDALFSSVSCSSSSLQPLRTSQVYKVKLGCQRLKLINLRAVC